MAIKFNLSEPISFFNSQITNGDLVLNYPSGSSYWRLLNNDDKKLLDGNYTFPSEVLNEWTTSDDVLINHLLTVKPWEIKPDLSIN
jgi:hypothetical protein